jgi:hypothetical protein
MGKTKTGKTKSGEMEKKKKNGNKGKAESKRLINATRGK